MLQHLMTREDESLGGDGRRGLKGLKSRTLMGVKRLEDLNAPGSRRLRGLEL